MAIQYDTYFSNAIVGQPQVGADIDVTEVNTTPKFAVGFGFTRADGNKYRYCCFSADSEPGYAVGTLSPTCNIVTGNACTAPASAVAVSGDNITVGNTGSRYMELTGILVSANQLAGSVLNVYGGTGVGFTYRVKGNTLTGAIGSGLTRVQLYEPLVTAIAADSDIVIAGSPWNNIYKYIDTAGTANVLAGVTCGAPTANQFGWVCEEGLTGAYSCVGFTNGYGVVLSGTTEGMLTNYTRATTGTGSLGANPVIGKAVTTAAAGACGIVRIGRVL